MSSENYQTKSSNGFHSGTMSRCITEHISFKHFGRIHSFYNLMAQGSNSLLLSFLLKIRSILQNESVLYENSARRGNR